MKAALAETYPASKPGLAPSTQRQDKSSYGDGSARHARRLPWSKRHKACRHAGEVQRDARKGKAQAIPQGAGSSGDFHPVGIAVENRKAADQRHRRAKRPSSP